jgi:hypothetical protein
MLALQKLCVPVKFVEMTAFQSSSDIRIATPSRVIPALFTSTCNCLS